MSFKRDPEKYPFINGEWLDEFASNLLKKKAQTATPDQTKAQIANEILGNVQNRGMDFDSAFADAQAKYSSLTSDDWNWIRSYAAQQTSAMAPTLNDPNQFADIAINYLISNGLDATPANVTNALDQIKKSYPAIASNENFLQTIRSIIESKAAPQGQSFDLDALVGYVFDQYRAGGATEDIAVVADRVAMERGLTPDQTQQLELRSKELVTKLQANSATQGLVDNIVQFALREKTNDFSLDSDQAINAAIASAAPLSGASGEYLRELSLMAKPIYEGKIQRLQEIATEMRAASLRDGVTLVSKVSGMASLSQEEKDLVISFSEDQGRVSGSFDEASFKSELSNIANELQNTISNSGLTSDTLAALLMQRSGIARDQQRQMLSSYENFVSSVNALSGALQTMSSSGLPATASVRERVIVAAGGISGFFKDLWLGKDDSVLSYQEAIQRITGMAHAVAAGMNRLNNLNDLLKRPNTPDVYKTNFNSVLTSFQNVQNSMNSMGSVFGFEPPTIAGMQQVLNNAKQAAESGQPSVDSFTGRPEQGRGQQVPPEQLMQALQGGSGAPNAGGQAQQGGSAGQLTLETALNFIRTQASQSLLPDQVQMIEQYCNEIENIFSAPSTTQPNVQQAPPITANQKEWIKI